MTVRLHGVVARGEMERRLDLDVADGEVVVLTGPNGVGKTTVIRTIAGLHRLSEGTLTVDDVAWDDAGSIWVPPRERRVGVVMQGPSLFEGRSVSANVAFAPRVRGVGREAAATVALGWLERVGAAHLARRRAGDLSGGEAQRVAIARALAADPALLLLDEPLSAVDAASVPGLVAILREVLADYGGGAVVVLHDLVAAEGLADRIIHLEFTPGP